MYMDPAERLVTVPLGERSYPIVVGQRVLETLGLRLASVRRAGKVAVVTDETVAKLYGGTAVRSLKAAGYQPHVIALPAGERTKTLTWLSRVLDQLVAARFERTSIIVALGGGVIGDLAGFAAAVYQRGIPFVQVPTTLVAQVDSSVGGKTGVNHPLGKNLIGAFHQPSLVLIDVLTLRTLPKRQWLAGLAEVIKYGVIADEPFFRYLEEHMAALLDMESGPVLHVVSRSCEIKASVVAEDERESDRRRILNYGHTIGHALERLGRYRSLVHGEAVAIGMVEEAGLARALGLCSEEVVSRQRDLIMRTGLRDTMPPVTFPQLWNAMQHDKKVAAGQVYCVFPEDIGRVRIAPVDRRDCRAWFEGRRPANRKGAGKGRLNGVPAGSARKELAKA
jgi:3-dehydroquinate synthase